jgi:hypothetical protein
VNLLRSLLRLVALPSRLVVNWVDSISEPKLTPFLRASVHGFVWVVALMAFSVATYTPPAPTAAPAVRTAPQYAPLPPMTTAMPPPSAAPAPSPSTGDVDVPNLPDIDEGVVEHEDHGESWFCRHRRWC